MNFFKIHVKLSWGALSWCHKGQENNTSQQETDDLLFLQEAANRGLNLLLFHLFWIIIYKIWPHQGDKWRSGDVLVLQLFLTTTSSAPVAVSCDFHAALQIWKKKNPLGFPTPAHCYHLVRCTYPRRGTRLCRCRWWAGSPRRQTHRRTPACPRWGWRWLWPESPSSAPLCSCHPGCSRVNTHTQTHTPEVCFENTNSHISKLRLVPLVCVVCGLFLSECFFRYAIPLSVLRAVVAHCRRCYRAVLGLIEATFPVRVALGRHPFLHLC